MPPRLKQYLNRDELAGTWAIAVAIGVFWYLFSAFTASIFGYPDSPVPTTIAVFMMLVSKFVGEREMLAEGREPESENGPS